ncbi:hypothetical protein F2P81_007417 [Scophthalmus maximus]|uniref:Uncharacterized protein n=1 Tax=Scophthalmus maximus TaxID=52904 RepID=A0A6A4T9M7_SCOMX|nr:hypothetical protein F2P81_007417 [Scophthalmus maximus]
MTPSRQMFVEPNKLILPSIRSIRSSLGGKWMTGPRSVSRSGGKASVTTRRSDERLVMRMRRRGDEAGIDATALSHRGHSSMTLNLKKKKVAVFSEAG